MSERPRILDLFCGAGGAAMGYHRAGFDVTGVDLAPQPRYPFAFVLADALAYVAAHGREFDAIHASPPCQGYSEATPVRIKGSLPRLIGATRDALQATGLPYVIENVEGARGFLRAPLLLCGTMFALPLWRHRYFETGGFWALSPSPCVHRGRPLTIHCGSNTRKTRGITGVEQVRRALDVPWMNLHEAYEAIPPAYTEWVGLQLRKVLI